LLGPAAGRLTGTRCTLTLDLTAVTVDLLGFDACMAQRDEHSLAHAVDLYRGELLEGWSSEWIVEHRRRRHEACVQALEYLAALLVRRGSPELAEKPLLDALRLDPCNEAAARALMELHASQGRASAAGHVYRTLRRSLDELVDVRPSRATDTLSESIRAQRSHRASREDTDPTLFEGMLIIADQRFPVRLPIRLPGMPRTGLRLELDSVPTTSKR